MERNFGTSQDRLIKEMRLLGISTLEDANRYLEEVYIDYWNTRFAVEPAEAKDAHRKLPKKANLEALFARTVTRSVYNDFTIRYKNRLWQIPTRSGRMPCSYSARAMPTWIDPRAAPPENTKATVMVLSTRLERSSFRKQDSSAARSVSMGPTDPRAKPALGTGQGRDLSSGLGS